MTNYLLGIIGRTDSQPQPFEHKKRPPKGPQTYLSSTLPPQSCSHPSGNLLSSSFMSLTSKSADNNRALPVIRSLTNQLTLLRTNFANKINSLSLISLYILIIINSFGCGTLRGGLTLKYDEVAREGETAILECKTHVVKSESQENKNTLQEEKNSETSKTISPAVKKALQK